MTTTSFRPLQGETPVCHLETLQLLVDEEGQASIASTKPRSWGWRAEITGPESRLVADSALETALAGLEIGYRFDVAMSMVQNRMEAQGFDPDRCNIYIERATRWRDWLVIISVPSVGLLYSIGGKRK